MSDKISKELYNYLRDKDRGRRPRIWPWVVLVCVVLILLAILDRTRILIVI